MIRDAIAAVKATPLRGGLRWLFLLCAVYLALLLLGMVTHYSPVPFWDGWGGRYSVLPQLERNGWNAIIAQHNEHRIVISRLLFLIDQQVFGDRGIFLYFLNAAFALFGAALLVVFLRDSLGGLRGSYAMSGAVLIVALAVSWTQRENLAWAFQSQFFLAQSLPLLGFYGLHRASMGHRRWFWAAAAAGVASVGTMANGLIALPLMAVIAVFLRLRWWQIAALGVLAVVTSVLYLRGYQTPGHHGSPLESWLTTPLTNLHFVARYLGAPLRAAFAPPKWMCDIAGFIVMAGALYAFVTALRSRKTPSTEWALIGFLAFIGATAAITAGGRSNFGVHVALAQRYVTPALMAWMALGIIFAARYAGWGRSHLKLVHGLLIAVLIVFLPVQIGGVDWGGKDRRNGRQAALAVGLGVFDPDRLAPRMPPTPGQFNVARQNVINGNHVFGWAPLNTLSEQMGQQTSVQLDEGGCTARIVSTAPVVENETWRVVYGAASLDGDGRGASYLRLVDAQSRLVGAVANRARWPNGEPEKSELAFLGYVQADAEMPLRLAPFGDQGCAPLIAQSE